MGPSLNWKSFVNIIKQKGFVPILGNDLSMIKLKERDFPDKQLWNKFQEVGTEEGDVLRINLYNYLAIKLWSAHGEGDLPATYSLNSVILKLQKKNINEGTISRSIKSILKLDNEKMDLEPYRNLAKIKGFEAFITVNIDGWLERAFEDEELFVNPSINYFPSASFDPNLKIQENQPKIFNIMSNIDSTNFAMTEEQSLEYLYSLQSENSAIAAKLFDSLRDKDILLIGCSFPNWFMRFFLRIMAQSPFTDTRITKYVACDTTLEDAELATFLQSNAISIVHISKEPIEGYSDDAVFKNSIEFITKMYDHFITKDAAVITDAGVGGRNEQIFEEELFLSYSWGDKPVMEELKNEFRKQGVKIFFDDDNLKTGDQFGKKIKNKIRDCDYFLAFISKNSIERKDSYVYDKEWRFAFFLDEEGEKNYIRPYILDDTSPTHDDVPEYLRERDIETLENTNDFSKMVRDFIRDNSLTKIEK